jgi:hypothetical protein
VRLAASAYASDASTKCTPAPRGPATRHAQLYGVDYLRALLDDQQREKHFWRLDAS